MAPELLLEGFVYDFEGKPASNVRLTSISATPGERIQLSDRPVGMRVQLYGRVKIDGSMTRCYGEHEDLSLGNRAALFFLKAPAKRRAEPTGTLPVSTSLDPELPGEYFALHHHRGAARFCPMGHALWLEAIDPHARVYHAGDRSGTRWVRGGGRAGGEG